MDVFSIGAGAPRAPEDRGPTRGADAKRAPEQVQARVNGDVVATSGDATTVASFVQNLASTPNVRLDIVVGFRQLLGRGVLDTPEAVDRAVNALTAR